MNLRKSRQNSHGSCSGTMRRENKGLWSMAEKKIHTAEEQHAAMDKIGGFTYQFYCFLLHLLKMKQGEIVSFEKLDDTAIESGNLITLYQAKHSIQVNANGETKALTNRSSDLWKALDVWRKLIVGRQERTETDQRAYISGHKFCFFSNKPIVDNKIVALCEEVQKGSGKDRIDAVLEEITNEGKTKKEGEKEPSYRTVQTMIDDLKAFELRAEFLKEVEFKTMSQEDIKDECIQHIADSIWYSGEEAVSVFDDFLTEAVKDFFEKADKGKPLSYTFEEHKKRFLSVFQYHREEKLDFRIIKEKYKQEFLDLVCIKQLMSVRDVVATETDKVAKYASQFYSFKNRFDKLKEDSRILEHEEEAFIEDAITYWDNEFEHAYSDLDDDVDEEAIVKKAKDILYKVRQHQVKLKEEVLGLAISNGAYYYLSDECIIGWHKNWQDFFYK